MAEKAKKYVELPLHYIKHKYSDPVCVATVTTILFVIFLLFI